MYYFVQQTAIAGYPLGQQTGLNSRLGAVLSVPWLCFAAGIVLLVSGILSQHFLANSV